MVFSFAFFGGACALLFGPALPPPWAANSIALVALLALASLVARRWLRNERVAARSRWRITAAAGLCGLCCGLLWTGFHAREYLDRRWPTRLADERVIASVIVDTIPAPFDSGWAFDGIARIEAPATLRRELRVRIVQRDGAIRPRAGERWRMLLALRPPRGRANPGTQDFERHLFRDRVHALGTVVASSVNRRIDAGHRPLAALREKISLNIDAQVADRDASALIAALAVGDTGRVSREQWRVFNVTGTTHLVAISGLHVTLFAVVAFFAARRVWSACLWLSPERHGLTRATGPVLRCPRETFAAIVGFGAATAYATLAGLSVPTQRTLIMLGVWLFARSVARASRPFQPFAVSLLLVLLVDPFAPLSAGFWLSFAAMGAIILITTGRFMRRPLWREMLAVQAVVTIALVPLSIALFGSVSLIGPLVNVAAIPAMSWVLVPAVLLSVVLMPVSTGAANAVLNVAAKLHDVGWPLLAAASDVPWALIHASPPWWWYGLATFAVTMALLPWPLAMRLAALLCIVPLAAAVERPLSAGVAEITVLDVGEGTSVVVRTARRVLVFGTGDSFGTEGRVAEAVVVPFLRSRGVRTIDRLVESEGSPAAASGVTAILAEIPVHQTLVDGHSAPDDAAAFDCASAPDAWNWDGVRFEMLSTISSGSGADTGHACLLSVSAGRSRALIAGSLDAGAEAQLVSRYDLKADIVVVARNGSDAASTIAFIEEAGARWAVVSGRRLHRSASKRALARWEQGGSEVLVTADLGAIRFRLDSARGVAGPEARRVDDGDRRRTLWTASP